MHNTTLEMPPSEKKTSQKTWRTNISCNGRDQEGNIAKEKFLIERLGLTRSALHWKLVDAQYQMMTK